MSEIILASKSKIRLEILKKNRINCESQPSNIDEDEIKNSWKNELENFKKIRLKYLIY